MKIAIVGSLAIILACVPIRAQVPTPRDSSEIRRNVLIIPQRNNAEIDAIIQKWEPIWHSPENRDSEAHATGWMVGSPGIGLSFAPPRRVIDAVVDRGLKYFGSEAKIIALHNFPRLLQDDVARFLPIFRDGLNDEDSEVRMAALEAVEQFWQNPIFAEFNDDETLKVTKLSETQMNEVIDTIFSKCFFDEEELIRAHARSILENKSIKPNATRLRSLKRICRQGMLLNQMSVVEEAEVVAPWTVAVYGGVLKKKPEPTIPEPSLEENPFD